MKNSNNNNSLSFNLKKIELIEKSLKSRKLEDNTVFKYDVLLYQHVDSINSIIIVNPRVTIKDTNNESDVLAHFSVNFIFHVEDIKQFIDEKNESIKLPEMLIMTINSISISTLRGIIYSELRGTFLHHTILPIFDTKNLIHKNQKNKPTT